MGMRQGGEKVESLRSSDPVGQTTCDSDKQTERLSCRMAREENSKEGKAKAGARQRGQGCAGRWAGGQAGRLAGRQAGRQAGGQAGGQICGLPDVEVKTASRPA